VRKAEIESVVEKGAELFPGDDILVIITERDFKLLLVV